MMLLPYFLLSVLWMPVAAQNSCACKASEIAGYQATLTSLMEQLQAVQVDATYEQISLFTSAYFVNATASDTAQAENETLAAAASYLNCNVTTNATCVTASTAVVSELLCEETCETMTMLASAIATAQVVLATPSSRVPPRIVNATGVSVSNSSGYFRDASGTPVFLGGSNDFPATTASNATGISYVNMFSMTSLDVWVGPKGDYLPHPDGNVSQVAIAALLQQLDLAASWGQTAEIFVDHSGFVDWVNVSYPGISDPIYAKNHFVYYDIDNPGFRFVYGNLLSQVAAAVAGHPALFGWMLVNEPGIFIAASNYTLAGYQAWLEATYINIAALNAVWGTTFSAFGDIPASRMMPSQHNTAITRAEWYDWNAFNDARTTAWFTFMADSIRSAAPNTMLHAKFINEQTITEFYNSHDIGMDREVLGELLDISGCDTRVPTTAFTTPGSSANYSISWFSTGASYDFQRSLQPLKPIYDSEWHDVSDDAFYTPDIPEGHMSTGLWLAHIHGMAGNQIWYWGRNANTSIFMRNALQSWFIWSLTTQPQMMASYSRTLLELNTFAALIPPFVAAPRRIALLYSEASAIQSLLYRIAMVGTYEAAYFLGRSMGYITDASLTRSCASLMDGPQEVLLIPNTDHVSDATVACLQAYAAAGRTIIVVGNVTGTEGGSALAYDAREFPRDPSMLSWLNSSSSVSFMPLPPGANVSFDPVSLFPTLHAAVAAATDADADQPVRCMDAATGLHSFGVMCRAVACDNSSHAPIVDGVPPSTLQSRTCNATLFMVNVLNVSMSVDVQVRVSHQGGSGVFVSSSGGYSVLNNTCVGGPLSALTLAPLEYVLMLV